MYTRTTAQIYEKRGGNTWRSFNGCCVACRMLDAPLFYEDLSNFESCFVFHLRVRLCVSKSARMGLSGANVQKANGNMRMTWTKYTRGRQSDHIVTSSFLGLPSSWSIIFTLKISWAECQESPCVWGKPYHAAPYTHGSPSLSVPNPSLMPCSWCPVTLNKFSVTC